MSMSRREIETGIERLGPWFHSIDLGGGLLTKTASVGREPADHPRGTWELVRECLPLDLTGKTVLDVGCNAGFYAVEAKRRGAARVLGVDAQRREIRQARFVRKALGLDIEFKRLSVYDLSLETAGVFDVTMALGLIYHLKHLVLALERLFEVTKELLILETAVLPKGTKLDVSRAFEKTYEEVLRPVAYLENPGDRKEAVFNWFLPSTEATIAMAKAVGFDEVTLAKQKGDRAVFACVKSRRAPDSRTPGWLASRLTLAGGPSTSARGESIALRVGVENRGLATWLAAGDSATGTGAVRLGAHLLDADGDELDWDYAETALPRDLAQGEREEVEIRLFAPETEGTYQVELDLVAENVAWFDDLGCPVLTHRLDVGPDLVHVPWFRAEGAISGLGAAAPPDADVYTSLRRALETAIGTLAPEAQVKTAFEWVLGQRPDATALRFHVREMARRADGLSWLLRRLLLKSEDGERPPDAPPEAVQARLSALAPHTESSRIERSSAGESFTGEAAIARVVLRDGSSLGDAAFVDLAFQRVLGRAVDDGGRDYYAGKLGSGEMNRPHLLRDLFWSEELRR